MERKTRLYAGCYRRAHDSTHALCSSDYVLLCLLISRPHELPISVIQSVPYRLQDLQTVQFDYFKTYVSLWHHIYLSQDVNENALPYKLIRSKHLSRPNGTIGVVIISPCLAR